MLTFFVQQVSDSMYKKIRKVSNVVSSAKSWRTKSQAEKEAGSSGKKQYQIGVFVECPSLSATFRQFSDALNTTFDYLFENLSTNTIRQTKLNCCFGKWNVNV